MSKLAVFISVSVLCAAAPAAAQSSAPAANSGTIAQGDVDAGFNPVMWVKNAGETTTYKGGWHAGASYRLKRIISVAAELSGDYRSVGGHTANIYTYAGGARFQSGRMDLRFKPFAQVLFGGGQDNGNGGGKINHYPMMTVGGGTDVGISRRAALRLRLDFPLLMTFNDPLSGELSAGHTLKATRLSIGVSLPFGVR